MYPFLGLASIVLKQQAQPIDQLKACVQAELVNFLMGNSKVGSFLLFEYNYYLFTFVVKDFVYMAHICKYFLYVRFHL